MTEYSRITAIHFVFTRCPTYPEAHSFLNTIYSSTLPNHERIYVNPDTQDEIKANTQLLETVRDILTVDCIGPDALDTVDEAAIRPLINRCTLSVNVGNQFPVRRLSKANLEAAFDFAIANNRIHDIRLSIGIHGLHFQPDLNYLNWGTDIVDDPSGFPPASVAATQPAPAMPSTSDIAAAVAAAVASAMAGVPAPAPSPAPSPSMGTIAGSSARFTFNPVSLPVRVRERYQAKLNGDIQTAAVIHRPFTTNDPFDGMRYWMDNGMDKVILADGTLFFFATVDEKTITKNPVRCTKDNHSSLRRWYDTFAENCRNHGLFVLPFWLFRKNHGGDWGFTIGDTRDDDVPTHMRLSCMSSSGLIYQILAQEKMFPSDSRIHNIVAQCYGDGYKALKSIIFRSHPMFHDQPNTLITTYPRQRELSLLEYLMNFGDYLQMRAMITNHSTNLDDENELDVFINNMKHSEYINRVTRDERRVRANRIKYQGAQLLETLERHLMAPDSPARKETITGYRPSVMSTPIGTPSSSRRTAPAAAPRGRRQPTGTRVNAIDVQRNRSEDHVEPAGNDDDAHDEADPNGPFPSYEDAAVNLLEVEIPDDEHALHNFELFNNYRQAINAIKSNSNAAYETRCIVCNGQHRFENCDVLNNADFLRQHYIRYCQNVRRDQAARNATFQGNADEHQGARVNFLDVGEYDNAHDDSLEDDEHHFQNGRL